MTKATAARDLAISGVIYLVALFFFGELYLGSNAMFLFGSIWAVQAISYLWRLHRARAEPRVD